MKADAVVLGAGIVGVSAALHLQAKGRDVVLIDRGGTAGDETSFGNAGLIERSSIFPYSFPRDLRLLFKYALNQTPEANYHLSALPRVLPWLLKYAAQSSEAGKLRSAMAALPLIERSVSEHEALMEQAGALDLLKKIGWIKMFRKAETMDKALKDAEKIRQYGIKYDVLDEAALALREPHLETGLKGAIHFTDPGFVPDPGALVKAYAKLFISRGGRLLAGDAMSLAQVAKGWRVATTEGNLEARDIIVALGPWSDDIFRRYGYRIPLGIKRGYHMHYQRQGNAVLNHSVLDVDNGYLIAPMNKGIRLTTGAEFARRDSPKTPVQLAKVEPIARKLFPLAERLDLAPWMGSRPCLPDMLPVIGPALRHKGLWFNFGHQHHGLTLGPVSGRLLAEMIVGEAPFTDPAPYRAERF
eukprot:gene12683-12778_t